mgnify:CR=1 FL=1
MKGTELHIMMKQLINNQGASFIADKRFANILLDMGCFGSYPKCKNVLKTINENDYVNRIISYMDGYEPKDEIFNTMFDELSTQYNYAKNDISYCIQCILYGLNILDGIEKYSAKLDYGWLNQLEEYCNISQEEVDVWNTEYCILNITPTDADVFVDGRRIKHDDEPIVLELTCGEHKIKACSPMYYNHEDSFMVSDDLDNSLSIELKPQFGSILIMTNAKDAMVYIDDVEIGIAPISMEKLASGTHTLRIEDTLHKKYEEVFVINDDQRLEKDIKMESNFGEVVLCTDDKDLRVYIDGQYQGVGSWKGQLPVGHHSIECKKESHFSKTLDVFVKLGDEYVNTFTLPSLNAFYGCLKVNVKPIGATVYLDGVYIGKSPLKYKNALTGKHIIKIVEQECRNKLEKEIEIEEGIITIIEEAIPLKFFKDYEKAEIGDYFYIDGTLSHQKSEDKKAVGVVFTLETTEEEKKYGWTHGQIMALENCTKEGISWFPKSSIENNDLKSYEESKFNKKHEWKKAVKDKDGYKYSNLDSIISNPNYFAFAAVRDFSLANNVPMTSGWYLPTIGQWNDVIENLFKTKIVIGFKREAYYNKTIKNPSPLKKVNLRKSGWLVSYWTSTLYNSEYCWSCLFLENTIEVEGFMFKSQKQVRAVAAF